MALDVPVFLLTGRTRANTLDIARRAGLRHLVAACNGSLIFDPIGDADLSVTPMKADEKADFRSMADDLRPRSDLVDGRTRPRRP